MHLCTSMTLVGRGPTVNTAIPLRCNSWNCPECAERRRQQLRALARAGNPDALLTLTVDPSFYESPRRRARALVDAWRRLRRLAEKEARRDPTKRAAPYGYHSCDGWTRAQHGGVPRQVRLREPKLPYLAVIEATKAGEPHLHILLRVEWIEWAWIVGVMQRLIGSTVHRIERIRSNKKTNAYVAKYVGKQREKFDGCKRYWRSQDYAPEWNSRDEEDDQHANTVWYVANIDFLSFLKRLMDEPGLLHVSESEVVWTYDPRARGRRPP